MRPTPALLLSMLLACGTSETEFQVEGITLLCEEIAACTGHVEVDACVDQVRSLDTSGCAFDDAAARECIDALEDAACETHPGTGRSSLVIPERCDEVYAGCGPLYDEPYDPAF